MGGLGLNLTAAECVFLLDPWRNPAEEAQAVDRAHHIGQRRQVFAYRLIARDTVEETVLQLQNAKRDLVAAIISENNSLIRNLQREDLESLRRLVSRAARFWVMRLRVLGAAAPTMNANLRRASRLETSHFAPAVARSADGKDLAPAIGMGVFNCPGRASGGQLM
ncbi:MAG: DEAD/DEAH box helicase [Acidobacteriia bacterium]|nr:DEAD/DEAH box helicase [Terriglobia bacterium]